MAYYREISPIELQRELKGYSRALNEIPHDSRFEIQSSYEGEEKAIVTGLGVDGIVLNKTTAYHLSQKYGSSYFVYEINGYSFEMNYYMIGLSCFFLAADPEKKIYALRMKEDFGAFIEPGYSLQSRMNLKDVFTNHKKEVQFTKSYDETHFVEFGFYRYHFIPEDCPPQHIPIQSIFICANQ